MTHLFQRLILFTIEGYLDDISPDTTYNYHKMVKLRSSIRGYMTFHKFSPDEYQAVMKLAEEPVMEQLKETEVDRTLFSLELLFLYVSNLPKASRANLNTSDSKLLGLKSELVLDMLKLKQSNPKGYDRVKEILDDSRIAAKRYYSYIETYFKEIDNGTNNGRVLSTTV